MNTTEQKQKPSVPKRQRMAPNERRAHILDAAQSLFFAHGWDNVTIADVLKQAGISKGGFYHHFTAKEDLLDGIVQHFTGEALKTAQAVRAAAKGGALDRFNAFLAETNRWKVQQGAQLKFFIDMMLLPGNEMLSHRITASVDAIALPVLHDIISHGVDEGAFDVPDINLVAGTIIAMSHDRRKALQSAVQTAQAGDIAEATTRLNNRMTAEAALMDRMLGLPQGSIMLSKPSDYRLMLEAIVHA